ncbi:MAG TPA: 4'-phosphopantetheinyl transferase superfamily protein [Verrucomicrobiae bacterium]|nr:4'-phosphopantetheinyl transferase superfamily protein [Verrucomicrobiae bacterium]
MGSHRDESTNAGWVAPPQKIELRANEVHVWRVLIDRVGNLKSLAAILSSAETGKADRFHFADDRTRFIVTHGVLRDLLGQYLGSDPASLRFVLNDCGKPFLVQEPATEVIHFNISHSRGIALLAFACGRELGVDVEHVRPEFAELDIARRFFAPEEVADLLALDETLRVDGFFNCWTRKESYIKARGMGLSLPLDSFHVSLQPGSVAALLGDRGNPIEASRWELRELSPGENYFGAITVEGRDWLLRTLEWSEERFSGSLSEPHEGASVSYGG